MKKYISVFLILSLSLLLFGCGATPQSPGTSEPAAPGVTADEITKALMEALEFNDAMEENDNDEKTCSVYGIDSAAVTDVSRYVGSGATAEEVAVFVCAGADSVSTVKTAVNERIKYLHNGYSDYGPEQVPEIDSAVVLDYGNTVIFCICKNPDSVKPVLDNLF